MVSLKEKYTDIDYTNKAELTCILEYHAIETVWNEIREYRKAFEVVYTFKHYVFQFTLTPQIFQKVIEAERELRNIGLRMIDSHLLSLILNSQQFEYEIKRYLNHQDVYDIEIQKQWFYTHPLLFICLMNCIKDHDSLELAKCCLQTYQFSWAIDDMLSILEDMDIEEGEDQTKFLLNFLSRLQQFTNKQANILDKNNLESRGSEGSEELCLQYPRLSKSLIDFFVEHRQWKHYYSVQDYQNWNQCSYETARSALNELVVLGWYKKMKVGKKFVYEVR